MFEGDNSGREWRSFLTDMIERGETVLAFTEGLGVQEFANDERTYKATLWDLSIIGESISSIARNSSRRFRLPKQSRYYKIVGSPSSMNITRTLPYTGLTDPKQSEKQYRLRRN